MTHTIDDQDLVAFLDGELDPAGIERVEAALAADPQHVRVLCALQRSAAALRSVLSHAATTDVPTLKPPVLRPAWHLIVAVAAMVVLALGSGLLIGSYNERQDVAAREQAARADEAIGRQSLQQALEHSVSQTTVAWKNPDTGTTGTVTPVRTWRNEQEQYCREYELTRAAVDGVVRSSGVACREDTGEWRVRAVYY